MVTFPLFFRPAVNVRSSNPSWALDRRILLLPRLLVS